MLVEVMVELLYFPDCPNVDAAREQLRRAFALVGAPAAWSEIDISASDAPGHLRQHGSPTVLVDGRDVTGDVESGGSCGSSCRVYAGSDVRGVPPIDAIVSALSGGRDRVP
jgi:hypothetical protein